MSESELKDNKPLIKEITEPSEINEATLVIRKSFGTVAREFGLTETNCPGHPSNVTFELMLAIKKRGLNFFGQFIDGEMIGFVAIENAGNGLFRFEKLAVLPEHRHQGFGRELVNFALDYALGNQAKKMAVGIIDEHTLLKEWYQSLGFRETGTQKFKHLPFTVGFLEFEFVMTIRPYTVEDENAVIELWQRCELVRPWNNPKLDIARKLVVNPELFLVGVFNGQVLATAMGGYEGHRGWVNYLAVDPACQKRGFGRQVMEVIEKRLLALGCPKINLQVRKGNIAALLFYDRIGYQEDNVISLGKRLISDIQA